MAQLSGVMTADFSDFNFEIDKSVVKLKDLEGASGRTNSAIGDFSEGLGAADKTLGALGIHIGPQIQAVRELGSAVGKTTAELGTWGTVAAGLGAFAAGWQIGTYISDWLGLKDAIGDATASLLGWGDAGLEATRAKMDLFARASNIAGRDIRDVATAMDILKQHNAAVAESFNTGTERVKGWNRELAAHANDLPTITAELKNHSSTVQQLAQHYNISKEAIEFYTRTLSESAKVQKAWADEARPKYEALAKAQQEINNAGLGWQTTVAAIAPATAALVQHYLNLGVSVESLATKYNLTTTQVKALDTQMQFNLATMAVTEPAVQTLDQWIGSAGKQFAVAAESGDQFKTMLELTGGVVETLTPKIEKLDTVFRSVTTAAAVLPGMDQKSPGAAAVPINTGNITYGLGGFEQVFAEYIRKHPSGGALGGAVGGGPPADFLTWALSMGLAQRGPTITNTFNIVDTQDGLANKIGDTITSQVQRGSLVN